MKRIHDGRILPEIGHVLCAYIDAAGTEILGDLRHELRIPGEGLFKPVRNPADSVKLRREVKLPFLERRLVTRRDDAFETVRERFGT